MDWPASGFGRELSAANPDALVLLSRRESPEAWWESASRTVVHSAEQEAPPGEEAFWAMCHDFLRARFTVVGATPRPPWPPMWPPLRAALGLPIPDEPFPHVNTSADFRSRADWDA